MRDYYQSQLDAINKNLIDMSLLLENAIENSILCLKNPDAKLIEASSQIELDINRMERGLEDLCLNVILHQQPVAGDFHMVSAALKMITDMERIGDIANDIALLSVMIKESRSSRILSDIIKMGKITVEMLKKSIDAYINRNVQIALEACCEDDSVDDIFNRVKEALVKMIKEEDKGAEEAPDLLMIAKYFERLGDHLVNVAQWVVYAFTGTRKGQLDTISDIDEAIGDIQ